MRTTYARLVSATVIAGRMRYGSASMKSVSGGIADCDGNHSSWMAKIAMRMRPLTNSGRPMNASEPTEIVWSDPGVLA